ncbi:MAG: glycerol kinase GlpK [Deltaproteobacteria bacterium]|nr:glycerol kinase GlpK [Deltaproteobacteria bacterium]
MSADVILSIDQGTTGTTVLAVSRDLEVLGKRTTEFRQIFPKPGWVEHDLEEIWSSTTSTIAALLEGLALDPKRIAAIGITNQRETIGVWEKKSGAPVHNAIVWQCRRTAGVCAELKAAGHEPTVRERTGLVLDPYFSATKLAWLLDEVDGARARAGRRELLAGTIDTFLLFRLTGGAVHATDVSNASRTSLFSLATGSWDDELCALFRAPREVLPEVRSSSEVYGVTRGAPGLPDGIPVAGIAGDQQAALFGQACFDDGDAKCTYGTGAFLLRHTGERIARSKHNLLTTCAWKLGPSGPLEYALEGSVFIAGAAVQWLRDGLGMIERSSDVEALARSVESSGDVVFVPALTGLGAPHWRASARGLITGITRDTHRGHIARATLEGIALSVFEVLEAFKKDAGALRSLRVDGGAAADDLLMQIQADVLGQPVVRPKMLETTAAGAAFLAGLAVGLFPSKDAIRAAWREERRFVPGDRARAEALIARWKHAVERA